MEPIIKIENLTVIYDKNLPSETKALENVSLKIYPHEFVIIFGPSGCGKSTLLYVMAGIERRIDNKSEVWIKGKNLVKMSKEELVYFHRKSMGMVFQAFNLISNLNVLQNVALPQVFSGADIGIRTKKAKAMLTRLNISQYAERFPQQLSGGQQQRVGIARALVNDTNIILADEPTGNLDSENAINVLNLLQNLSNNEKKTVVMVTHEANYIKYGTRIVYMKDGKILKEEGINSKIAEKTEEEIKKEIEQKTDDKKKTEIKLLAAEPRKTASLKPLLEPGWELGYYFGINFTNEENRKFKKLTNDFFEEKITENDFLMNLDTPFNDGGMGFYKNTALKIMLEIKEIKKLFRALKEKPEKKETVSSLILWLFKDYNGPHLSILASERIEKFVLKRIKNEINKNDFQKNLDMPFENGGAGLNAQTARNLTKKIEIILNQ